MTTPFSDRYTNSVIHVRPFGPEKVAVGLWGVPVSIDYDVVSEAIEAARAENNTTAEGLPNIGTLAPLLFVAVFTRDDLDPNALSVIRAVIYSPNGEVLFDNDREFMRHLETDTEAEQAFHASQRQVIGDAFACEDAFDYLNYAYSEALQKAITIAKTFLVLHAIGRLQLDERGEYLLDEQGRPKPFREETAQAHEYERTEIADANEREIPGDNR